MACHGVTDPERMLHIAGTHMKREYRVVLAFFGKVRDVTPSPDDKRQDAPTHPRANAAALKLAADCCRTRQMPEHRTKDLRVRVNCDVRVSGPER